MEHILSRRRAKTKGDAAYERITDREIANLEGIVDAVKRTIAKDDVYENVELDYSFHTTIAAATKNRFLAEAINQLNRSSLRLWYLSHLRLGLSRTGTLHAQIIEVLRRRDSREAADVMRQHILRSKQNVATAPVFGTEGASGDGAKLEEGEDQ